VADNFQKLDSTMFWLCAKNFQNVSAAKVIIMIAKPDAFLFGHNVRMVVCKTNLIGNDDDLDSEKGIMETYGQFVGSRQGNLSTTAFNVTSLVIQHGI